MTPRQDPYGWRRVNVSWLLTLLATLEAERRTAECYARVQAAIRGVAR